MTSDQRVAALCDAVRYVVTNRIPGDIVECGVWKGGSMMAVARTLLDLGDGTRELHLFDTFEGFDPRDLEAEEQLGYNTINYDDFSDTNMELVMSKMSHKENIIVRKGWFDEKTKTAAFTLNNLETTDNVILSFKAKKHDGILTIKLNGEAVFENNIEQETVAPINLKKDLLKEDNSLDFTVSSVGLKFWKTNEYSLENIKIIGDITDRSKQESRNIFTLTSKDLANIEEANLRFVPYCQSVADVGTLDITINSRNLFSAVPVCDDSYKQPIPIGLLDAGENKIIFKTSRGSYSVEQIKIEFKEKEVEKKVYYFEINQSQIDEIESGDKNAILRLEFVDDKENKMADININDHFITLDDDERVFTKNVNEFIEEGNNFIEIRPRTRLDIVELSIKLEER